MFAEEHLLTYDVHDAVGVVVDAPAAVTAIEYAPVEREQFAEFSQPGYAKTVYELSVQELEDGRTLLTGAMRTATTDEHARTWFRRYWALGVGSGAHVLVNGVLEQAREAAERDHARHRSDLIAAT